MDSMLGKLVRMLVTVPGEMLGTLCDLAEKLASNDGATWLEQLKHFLRKEPCWVVQSAVTVATNVYHFVVDYTSDLADMIRAGQYDWVNDNITQKNFPRICEAGVVELDAELLHFNRFISSTNAVKEMKKLGFRPATVEELLSFGAINPEIQRQFPIVALGSSCVIGGGRRVACLSWDGSKRDLDLYWWIYVWLDSYRLLAVRN